jgi:hypothetical protein
MSFRRTVRQSGARTANDRGFTLIEAITMIAVISVLGVVLWSGATLAMRALSDMDSHLDGTGAFLLAEHALREECGKIRFPYWLGQSGIEQNESGLTVHYLEGRREDTLVIGFENNRLWIAEHRRTTDGEEEVSRLPYGPFGGAEFSTARAENRGVYGIAVTLRPFKKQDAQDGHGEADRGDAGGELAITAEFGALPLGSHTDENN